MTVPAADSAIDIAYWFFNHAEDNGWYLENEKVHHLLFLAQAHYALLNKNQYLFPSVFICNNDGFSEPNISKILAQGRPFMPQPKLAAKVTDFLEVIWQKYASQSLRDLTNLVKATPLYADTYKPGLSSIVFHQEMASKFQNKSAHPVSSKKKILISQNGPVVVSKWQPRKITPDLPQGEKNV